MIRSVVIGAAGYTGIELVGLLSRHPEVELAGLFGSPGRNESVPYASIAPQHRGVVDLMVEGFDQAAVASLSPDVVLLATPHEASASIAPGLVDLGVPVIDLSGAFRLSDAALYPKHYDFEHPCPSLLGEAAYGIPEINREAIASAPIVAVAGCYPTSAIIPLAALVGAGAVKADSRVIIDSVSGVSGAGRKAALGTSFCEVSLAPYGVLSHRHEPEISLHGKVPVIFTPHVGPYERGIVSTIHVELAEGWSSAGIGEAFASTYGAEPFVRLLPSGFWPSVNGVRHTNFVDIAFGVREGHLVVCSAIDNLIKGAAGQAVQCMNLRLGLAEPLSLLSSQAVTA